MNEEKPFVRVLIVGELVIAESEMAAAGIRVIGVTGSGKEGVNLTRRLCPDVIMIVVETPQSDDLEAIEVIMKNQPTPILLLVGCLDERLAREAVSRGALEVFQKEEFDSRCRRQLLHKLRVLAGVKVIRHISGREEGRANSDAMSAKMKKEHLKAVIIASSLGGAAILEIILSQLAADFPAPIVVAQHISEGFSEELADWLDHKTSLTVRVATHGARLLPGLVLIAPPEYDVRIAAQGTVALSPCLPGVIYHPCCDSLLSSAADVYQEAVVGVILTGMGADGVEGIAAIKRAGGFTMAQDEESSLIYNMPRLAIERGLIDLVVSADAIAAEIKKAVFVC
ncbi:chemotaxis protein CheB [Azotosporobacter soli]|uniref:chemotaxis protein CheB n=1 Tax=Azotosporobacter soli TaxID=3055040 RepID=UPI0031FEA6EF